MPSDIREKVTEWLTGGDTCFLLGAGCSVCAGKPLIRELTTQVMAEAPEKLRRQFEGLKPVGDRRATVEDLITYLLKYRDVLTTLSNVDGHTISIAEIDEWLKTIKQKIVSKIEDAWKPSPYHARFLQRIPNPRPGQPRDVFSLNYDTILEATLDDLRVSYVDGFRGTNRAWFEPDAFSDSAGQVSVFRLYKLHGSINWTRDSAGHVRRGHPRADAPHEPIVVYPSEQKYLQTQYGVFETLMMKFRDRLRLPTVNNCLVVLGYSFNDDHINEAIHDAITSRNSNLTVVTFVGPEEDRPKQVARLTAFAGRCDNRFNAFIANGEAGHFIGQAVDATAATSVLDAELWKFEKLVAFIAGEAA